MTPAVLTPADLPPRLHQPQVIALAGYSVATLRKRQAAGRMPKPIDRGPRGGIYDRDAVLKALGMKHDEDAPSPDPWDFAPGAVNRHLARTLRRPEAPR